MVTGEQVAPMSLADFHGRKVILYFYPKDETSGCTKEACAFRDGYSRYTNAGLVVLGCSVDSADAHKDFIRKNSLPFPLLLDPDKKIARHTAPRTEFRSSASIAASLTSSTRTAKSSKSIRASIRPRTRRNPQRPRRDRRRRSSPARPRSPRGSGLELTITRLT